MGEALADRLLRQMLDVVDAGARADPTPGHMPYEVLSALTLLVRCDDLSFLDMDVATGTHHAMDSPMDSPEEWTTEPRVVPDSPFWKHYRASDSCSYPTNSGDCRTVTLQSDFCSDREWHASPMYLEAFDGDGHDHELMCSLPTVGTRARRLCFFRWGGSDFDQRDRMVMTLLRPHLVEIFGRQRIPVVAMLTRRQTELLEHVARGRSNAEIAKRLCLSEHTVRKHLENIFERLGVTNRTAAVAEVFPHVAAADRR